jgi:gliding motility-associated-like protein
MVGGAPAMNVNATTGLITAAPTNQGFFTFALTIEEFRDTTAAQNGPKVKIGETRRDVQYISLNCTSGSPPTFLNLVPQNGQTIQIPYNYEYCKDLIFNDINATDTLYFTWNSQIFDSGAYQATLPPDVNGDLHYYYNWNGSAWNDSVVIPPNQYDTTENAEWNIGTVAQRFCWTPGCDEVGKTFPFQVNAYSLGCDGKSQDSILFNIEVVPPPAFLGNPGDIEVTYGNNQCVNLVFEDSTIVDLLNIEVTSGIFSEVTAPAEFPSLPNNYEYVNNFQPPVVTGVPNNASNHFVVATQFCWYPDCEHIGGTFPVQARLYSVDCPEAIDDTINFNMIVKPPFDSLDVIPNVISPNGDGMNDVYTFGYINDNGDRVGGVSNPCTDEIKIEIFNRWGIKVFESEDPEFAWDGKNNAGKDVPAGTYFVLVHGTYGNETVKLDQRSVTVMR